MQFDFREFTEEDWYAFGGAEPFEDGMEPLIAEAGADALVIIDRTGVFVTFNDEGETVNYYADGPPAAVWRYELLGWFIHTFIGVTEFTPDTVAAQGFNLTD